MSISASAYISALEPRYLDLRNRCHIFIDRTFFHTPVPWTISPRNLSESEAISLFKESRQVEFSAPSCIFAMEILILPLYAECSSRPDRDNTSPLLSWHTALLRRTIWRVSRSIPYWASQSSTFPSSSRKLRFLRSWFSCPLTSASVMK